MAVVRSISASRRAARSPSAGSCDLVSARISSTRSYSSWPSWRASVRPSSSPSDLMSARRAASGEGDWSAGPRSSDWGMAHPRLVGSTTGGPRGPLTASYAAYVTISLSAHPVRRIGVWPLRMAAVYDGPYGCTSALAQVIRQRRAQMRCVLDGARVTAAYRGLRDLDDLRGQRDQVAGEVVEVVADPVQQFGADRGGVPSVVVPRVVIVEVPDRAVVVAADLQREHAALHVADAEVLLGEPVVQRLVGVHEVVVRIGAAQAEQPAVRDEAAVQVDRGDQRTPAVGPAEEPPVGQRQREAELRLQLEQRLLGHRSGTLEGDRLQHPFVPKSRLGRVALQSGDAAV